MKYGFVKIAAVSPEIRVGDCAFNAASAAEAIKSAAKAGAVLTVLPRLGLTGAVCGDLFLNEGVLSAAFSALMHVAEQTAEINCVAAVGLPMRINGGVYDCAAVVSGGKILGVVPRTEAEGPFSAGSGAAPFADGSEIPVGTDLVFRCRSFPELAFTVEIDEVKETKAPAVAVLSALPETTVSEKERRLILTARSLKNGCGVIFSSAGISESTTDGAYSGHCMAVEKGAVVAENKPFDGQPVISELDFGLLSAARRRAGGRDVYFSLARVDTELSRIIETDPFCPSYEDEASLCERALDIQAFALKKRMLHINAKKAVIGISGGLDSTIALLAACRAMKYLGRGNDGVYAVTMPCFGTGSRTKSNAVTLCESLGVPVKEIDISGSVRKHFEDIGHPLELKNVTFENAQARERTQILFDIANDVGGLVVGTGDLSELALGFATYNGDHMSSYAVNGSIPKTLIRHIVRHVANTCGNEKLAAVLLDIVDTPVSPELLPGAQVTEDIIGPYELHDFFLYNTVKNGFSPAKVAYLAKYAFRGRFDGETVDKWLGVFCKRFINNQFKRSCMCDGPQVTEISFSPRCGTAFASDAAAEALLSGLR